MKKVQKKSQVPSPKSQVGDKFKIILTMGDPQGIGSEIIVKSLLSPQIKKQKAQFIVVGTASVFSKLSGFQKFSKLKNIIFIDLPVSGKLNPTKSGKLSYLALQTAVDLIKQKKAHALVTAPISKERIKLAGFDFPGHTEFLCHEFGVKKYAMMLFHPQLRVVLTTIHLPLCKIFSEITQKAIVEKLVLTAEALKSQFKIKAPKIAVCGLNPHAGENGLLGSEEKTIISPAIKTFLKTKAAKSVSVFGPLSADTVFHQALQGEFDAVLCHYHDQALIPLKTTNFYQGVNMTLGLPFVRTSPDHGTAFDIAGKNQARADSMIMAIEMALFLSRDRS